jgi:hypothetical protein
MTLRMKSLCIAIATLVLAVLVWAQQQSATKSDVGRFQIFNQPSAGEVLGASYLVDTATGKVWRRIDLQSSNEDDFGLEGAPRVWVPMSRLDSKNDLVSFSQRHPEKTQYIKDQR